MKNQTVLLVLLVLASGSVLCHIEATYLNQSVSNPTSTPPAALEKLSHFNKEAAHAGYYHSHDSYKGCLINECCYKLLSKVKTGCLAVVPVLSSVLTYWFAALLLKLSGMCSSYVTANVTATATGTATAINTVTETATTAVTVTIDTTLTVYGVTLVSVTSTEISSVTVFPTETVTTAVTVSTATVTTVTTEYNRNCNTTRRRGFFLRMLNIEAYSAADKHEAMPKAEEDKNSHYGVTLPIQNTHSLPQVQPSFHSIL